MLETEALQGETTCFYLLGEYNCWTALSLLDWTTGLDYSTALLTSLTSLAVYRKLQRSCTIERRDETANSALRTEHVL